MIPPKVEIKYYFSILTSDDELKSFTAKDQAMINIHVIINIFITNDSNN
jgi:hypothetical protein